MSTTLRPMSAFDPSALAMVHDRLHDKTFEWSPAWQADYERYAKEVEPGVISFYGLLLDGWLPALRMVAEP